MHGADTVYNSELAKQSNRNLVRYSSVENGVKSVNRKSNSDMSFKMVDN